MDVILLKDVEKLGKEGAVVHVKPGFARNHLLPRGLALAANAANLKVIEERAHQAQLKAQRHHKQLEQLKRRLESMSLTLKLTLGERDQAFGSITAHDVAQALAQEGLTVEKHTIGLEEPIKTLGIYEIPIRLDAQMTATLKMWVVKA